MSYELPTFTDFNVAAREIHPNFRTMRAFWDYINSNRGTMGQDFVNSRDESEYWDEPGDAGGWFFE